MIFAGSAAMRQMDQYTIHTLGVPGEELMLRAATGAAEAAKQMVSPDNTVSVFCGSGNNGGDGIGIAALLRKSGYSVRCFMIGAKEKMSADSREMLRLLEKSGGILENEPDDIPEGTGVIVDALFGTGLSRDISGKYYSLIEKINASDVPVLACDIASGISADDGKVLGIAVRADVTVTFNLPKTGQLLPPGTEYTGKLIVHDIGIPQEAVNQASNMIEGEYVTENMVRAWLPKRRLESHKGDYGKLLLLCGARGYTGAAVMAAKSALRTGAGLVYLSVPETIYPIVAGALMEPVVSPLMSDCSGGFGVDAIPQMLSELKDKHACLIGPGIGRGEAIHDILNAVLQNSSCPIVIDADGLSVIGKNTEKLRQAKVPVVLTPHEGEFARLGGSLSSDRITAAKELAGSSGAVVVLKGYRTVTASPDGRVYVNSTGNSGMATGGSGDVLSGILTCLLGQGMEPAEAAAAAVWIHGSAGDYAADQFGKRSMLPGDMIEALPKVLKRFDL